jgi:hypothetical protein
LDPHDPALEVVLELPVLPDAGLLAPNLDELPRDLRRDPACSVKKSSPLRASDTSKG